MAYGTVFYQSVAVLFISPKRCAKTYEANKEVNDAHIAEVLPTILQKMEWKNNELILDHGCGTGSSTFQYLIPYVEKYNSTIYGLDNSQSMLDYASKHFGHPNIKYVHGTLTSDSNPVKDLKFNKIFSLYTLHFIFDYKREIKALYDALVPGGELYFLVVLNLHTFDLYAQIMGNDHWADLAAEHLVIPKWLSESDDENHKILKNAILETGFEIKELDPKDKTYVFKTPVIFADMMFAVNAFAKHLPCDQHDVLKDKYRTFFVETETKYHSPHPEAATSEYILHYDALFTLLKKPE